MPIVLIYFIMIIGFFYFVMKGLNEYENKNKKPNNNIYIQKISKEFFNEKIYFYEIYNLKSR